MMGMVAMLLLEVVMVVDDKGGGADADGGT